MYDICALGELLIDFTEAGLSDAGMRLFEQNAGGAVCNMLCAAARLGANTTFIGKVGDDMHGQFLKSTLENAGIGTKHMIMASDVFTTLAFVALAPNGERTFSFARKPGADTCLTEQELDEDVIKNTKIFHLGSLSLTDEPARGTTYKALELARSAGAVISYDPNYRASLWKNEAQAREYMRSVLPYANIMKLSDEECELLTDISDVSEAAKKLNAAGVECVSVTLGSDGALVSVRGEQQHVKGARLEHIVDTTGAGDAYMGGFVYGFLASGKKLSELTVADAVDFAYLGNASAGKCIQKRGGIPAMAERDEVMALYEELKKL